MFHPEIKDLSSIKQLRAEGKIKEALQVVLELEQEEDLSHKELLSYKLLEADLLRILGKFLDAVEIAKEIFQEFQKLGDLVSSFDALIIQAYSYMMMIHLSKSENIIRQAEDLIKIINQTSSIDLRERESLMIRIKASIHFLKGEIQPSLTLNKKAYKIAKNTGNKGLISASLNNIADKYYYLEEYDKAIVYAKEAIKLNCEPTMAICLATLIDNYISKGDIEDAKVYLDQLYKISKKMDTKLSKTVYLLEKALILKSSLRARERIKSEDLFKEIAMDNTVLSEHRIKAIINLCDLFLIELRITNDPDLINEINPYIQELLEIAEHQHLYLFLAEAYLLQAKLSLLTYDIKNANQFLTQAQNIAEKSGIKQLAMKISYEHDELLKQIKMWESLKESDLSLSERLNLAGLNVQVEKIMKNWIIEVPEISDEESVLLLVLSEGGIPLFSHTFAENKSFESHLLSGFLTTIDSFIRETFSEGLDRAMFGNYTLLMKSIPPFIISYIFKGNSYNALQRMNYFITQIQKEESIWQTLLKFFQVNKFVRSEDIPLLESLITEIFINKKNCI
ncbi:MAG: type IV pilus biogenesis/stability protein PilW [Candidatus Hermodarchaeota archaeon]